MISHLQCVLDCNLRGKIVGEFDVGNDGENKRKITQNQIKGIAMIHDDDDVL